MPLLECTVYLQRKPRFGLQVNILLYFSSTIVVALNCKEYLLFTIRATRPCYPTAFVVRKRCFRRIVHAISKAHSRPLPASAQGFSRSTVRCCNSSISSTRCFNGAQRAAIERTMAQEMELNDLVSCACCLYRETRRPAVLGGAYHWHVLNVYGVLFDSRWPAVRMNMRQAERQASHISSTEDGMTTC